MPSAYYTCNLIPVDLVTRNGYAPRWLGNYLLDPSSPARREALSIHPMTCPYVTRLVSAADALLCAAPEGDCLIVPGGCDAMRRLGDLLAATYPGRVFVLAMPRASGEGAARSLAADLARLDQWLAELAAGAGPAAPASDAHCEAESSTIMELPALDYPSTPRTGGAFVVAGPLSDNFLLRLIDDLGPGIAGLESCTSPDRWRPLAAAPAAITQLAGASPAGAAASDAEGYFSLASEALAIGMCPRRSTADRRDHLARRLDEAQPGSVIYARQSFCDPGAYDALIVAELAEERGLPFLEIEAGFPFEASGPLRTRVEAFLEAQLLDDDLLDDDLMEEED